MLKPIDFVATLLEGKVKYQKLPSGSSDYIEFYDKNGEMVATIDERASKLDGIANSHQTGISFPFK